MYNFASENLVDAWAPKRPGYWLAPKGLLQKCPNRSLAGSLTRTSTLTTTATSLEDEEGQGSKPGGGTIAPCVTKTGIGRVSEVRQDYNEHPRD